MGQIKEFLDYLIQSIKIWVIIQPWESGLIVRGGKRIREVSGGIFFKIPYYDSVYVQENRLRIVPLTIQTLTTKDEKTITLNASIGYLISDLKKLYETLYRPEMTIQNIVMSEISSYINANNLSDLTLKSIESEVFKKINLGQFGIGKEYLTITNYAVVRTYRLIQDQTWVDEGLKVEEKRK